MKYALSINGKAIIDIREHNIQAHEDIERDLQNKKDGLFTFTLRINGGNIVDYNVTEFVDVKNKYFIFKSIVVKEYTLTYYSGERGSEDPIWSDNLQHGDTGRGG